LQKIVYQAAFRSGTVVNERMRKTMKKIMKRLFYAVCLALLLSGQVAAEGVNPVTVEVLSKTGLSWDGRNLPNYPQEKPEITILRIKIPPGATLKTHMHPVINVGVLLAGELTVISTQDNKTLHLKAGEPIVEVVDTWHYGKNEGSVPAEIIVFYAGAKGTPITVYEEHSTQKPAAPPDRQ
jgi:quercetin dioxygenase-like cupin family protein